jgi:hypothetical protein
MKLNEAVTQVGLEEDIEQAFARLYGSQIHPSTFVRWHQALRHIPADLLPKIQETSKLSPDEAFKVCCPDFVTLGVFMDAVIASRKPTAPEV